MSASTFKNCTLCGGPLSRPTQKTPSELVSCASCQKVYHATCAAKKHATVEGFGLVLKAGSKAASMQRCCHCSGLVPELTCLCIAGGRLDVNCFRHRQRKRKDAKPEQVTHSAVILNTPQTTNLKCKLLWEPARTSAQGSPADGNGSPDDQLDDFADLNDVDDEEMQEQEPGTTSAPDPSADVEMDQQPCDGSAGDEELTTSKEAGSEGGGCSSQPHEGPAASSRQQTGGGPSKGAGVNGAGGSIGIGSHHSQQVASKGAAGSTGSGSHRNQAADQRPVPAADLAPEGGGYGEVDAAAVQPTETLTSMESRPRVTQRRPVQSQLRPPPVEVQYVDLASEPDSPRIKAEPEEPSAQHDEPAEEHGHEPPLKRLRRMEEGETAGLSSPSCSGRTTAAGHGARDGPRQWPSPAASNHRNLTGTRRLVEQQAFVHKKVQVVNDLASLEPPPPDSPKRRGRRRAVLVPPAPSRLGPKPAEQQCKDEFADFEDMDDTPLSLRRQSSMTSNAHTPPAARPSPAKPSQPPAVLSAAGLATQQPPGQPPAADDEAGLTYKNVIEMLYVPKLEAEGFLRAQRLLHDIRGPLEAPLEVLEGCFVAVPLSAPNHPIKHVLRRVKSASISTDMQPSLELEGAPRVPLSAVCSVSHSDWQQGQLQEALQMMLQELCWQWRHKNLSLVSVTKVAQVRQRMQDCWRIHIEAVDKMERQQQQLEQLLHASQGRHNEQTLGLDQELVQWASRVKCVAFNHLSAKSYEPWIPQLEVFDTEWAIEQAKQYAAILKDRGAPILPESFARVRTQPAQPHVPMLPLRAAAPGPHAAHAVPLPPAQAAGAPRWPLQATGHTMPEKYPPHNYDDYQPATQAAAQQLALAAHHTQSALGPTTLAGSAAASGNQKLPPPPPLPSNWARKPEPGAGRHMEQPPASLASDVTTVLMATLTQHPELQHLGHRALHGSSAGDPDTTREDHHRHDGGHERGSHDRHGRERDANSVRSPGGAGRASGASHDDRSASRPSGGGDGQGDRDRAKPDRSRSEASTRDRAHGSGRNTPDRSHTSGGSGRDRSRERAGRDTPDRSRMSDARGREHGRAALAAQASPPKSRGSDGEAGRSLPQGMPVEGPKGAPAVWSDAAVLAAVQRVFEQLRCLWMNVEQLLDWHVLLTGGPIRVGQEVATAESMLAWACSKPDQVQVMPPSAGTTEPHARWLSCGMPSGAPPAGREERLCRLLPPASQVPLLSVVDLYRAAFHEELLPPGAKALTMIARDAFKNSFPHVIMHQSMLYIGYKERFLSIAAHKSDQHDTPVELRKAIDRHAGSRRDPGAWIAAWAQSDILRLKAMDAFEVNACKDFMAKLTADDEWLAQPSIYKL